jgi:lipopolysaccharide biosynthesis regulator YciM
MDFDLQWLLWGLPLAFALGWLASRIDLRQRRRDEAESPKVYYKGLNLLLNEQHDKAIDAFIEAVQHDPDTSDLHFALGDLFRRRGEYERAVRVHEHLLQRADLPKAERARAQYALAQDYLKAGLFDRAEAAYRALEGTAFATEARLALLGLLERSREWNAAIDVARQLEASGTGSFAAHVAHCWCEIALEADAASHAAVADAAVEAAREAAPQAPRPLVLAGQRAAARGEHARALDLWGQLIAAQPTYVNLVAREYAASATAIGQGAAARERLLALYRRAPSVDLLEAVAALEHDAGARRARVLEHLRAHPSLSAAQVLLAADAAGAPEDSEARVLRDAVQRAARPLHRYRCAACAFEAAHHFWQCPACLNWDTYPPQRLDDQ